MAKTNLFKKVSATLMAGLTMLIPMATAAPTFASTRDDDESSIAIESVSEAEDAVVVEAEAKNGTVFVEVKNEGGKVNVTVDGKQTSYRADNNGKVRREDKNAEEADAVTLSEDGRYVVITKEEGAKVNVEAVADDAYNVAEYTVSTDAGAKAETELTAPYGSVNYDVTVQGNKVVTVNFAAVEAEADAEAEVKAEAEAEAGAKAEAEEENGLPKLTTEIDEAAVAYTMPGGEGFEHIENLIREYAEAHPELIAEIEDTVSAMADTKTVTIDNTGLIAYGGYNTHAYRANGRDRTAFCVQPALRGLGSGTYTATNLDKLPVQNISDIVFMKAVTYNAYGAPGYNQAKVQAAYEKYCHIDRYAFSHLVLSCIWYQYAIHNGYTVVSWANGQPQSTIDGVNGFIDAIMHDEDVKKDAVGFDVYYIKTPGYQDMVFWETTTTQLYLKKESANPSLTNGNSSFSLEGAIYTVYADSSCTKYRAQLKTDAKGISNTVKLDAGTYYVKETKAPKGFAADKTVHKVKLIENQMNVLKVVEQPNNNGKLTLIKESANPDMTNGNPCYSLKGTTYQVFGKENDAKAATGNVEQNKKLGSYVGTLVCNEDGTTNTISNILPGTYYYVEVVAGKGYLLNDVVEDVEVKSSAEPTVIHTTDVPGGDPGGFSAVKINAETGKPVTSDTASKGAQITVKYFAISDDNVTLDELKEKNATRTWKISLDRDAGNGRFVGSLADKYLSEDSDPLYTFDNGAVIIPMGYVTVQETGAPKNYALKNATITAPDGTTISDKDGVVMGRVIFDEEAQEYRLMYGDVHAMLTAANSYDFEDVPLRGDMEFVKVDENDKPLKNIAFRLERLSVSDGHVIESHIIHTDDEGKFSTANDYAPHDHNTNGGKVGDGVWFGESEPDNSKGALPAGEYRLQEIRTKENRQFKMETIEFSVNKNGETVVINGDQSGKIVDTKITIKTTAKGSASKSHYENADADTGIIDTVEYTGLNKGDKYKMVATLMDKETGTAVSIDGKSVTASKEFVAESSDGAVDIELKFDASKYNGKDVVVFEKLYVIESELNGEEIKDTIAKHEDIEDEGQTIHFPSIGTQVRDKVTETNTTAAVVDNETHEATIDLIDTVSYKNVAAGKEYIAKGRIVDEKGEPFLDKDGKEITAESDPFEAEGTEGTAEVNFHFVISEAQKDALAGKHIVVFEVLTDKQGKIYAKHEDINDKKQTINFPQLETTAADLDNGTKNVMADEEAAIADTVDYKGLLPEKEYTIHPTLHIAEEKDGKVVESEKTVEVKAVALADKPEDRKSAEEGVKFTTPALTEEDKKDGKTTVDGSVKIAVFYDASALVGERVVVFEDLYDDKLLIATHHDIADEDQTVYHPSVHTTAIDDETETQNTGANAGRKITDTVAYENCLPETEYTVAGVLVDKETGKAVMNNGKEVTAKATFKTDKAADGEKVVGGTTKVTFDLDATGMDGKTLVVFEELYITAEINDDNKVAEHKDIEDDKQSIYVPVIRTHAKDIITGTHAAMPSAQTTIEDEVSYKNLLPGKEYEMKATLVEKESGKELTLIADNSNGAKEEDVAEQAGEQKEAASEPTEGTWVFHAESKEFSISLYKDGKEVASEKTENGEDIVFANIPFGEYDVRFYDNTVVEDVDENGNPTALIGPARAEKMTFTYEMSEEYKASAKDSETAESGKDNAGTTQTVKFTTPELTEEQKKNGETTVSGSVVVTFTINSSALMGKTVVAFEKLYYQGKELAVHADINDEEQSVHFPEIKTTLKNAAGDTKNILAAKAQKVTDTVAYKNLVPGTKYKTVCTLIDKKSGKAVLVNGKPVTASAEFVPEKENGTVDVTVTFDATGLEGTTIVAFEKLYLAEGEKEVANHEDIKDIDQTIYVPKISTSLKDSKDGDKNVLASNSTTVIDTVKYDGLEDGKEYKAVCTLTDKSTGKAISVNGKVVTGEATFKAKGSSGSVDVKVTFNASGLGGRKLVAFEKLYAAGGKVEVAKHEDINDREQTVTMVTPPSTPNSRSSTVGRIQTGDTPVLAVCVIAAIALAAFGFYFFKKKK